VEKGRRFLAERQSLLTKAENTYGVSKEVITAILTVESDLGNKTGKYPVFNVFSSLAVMDTPEVISMLSLDTRLMGRLQKKAAWGRSELIAFLTYCQQNRLDPLTVKGSWAGAFGFSQFLPSSILRSGADGNRDGCVDLFCYEDAVFSIGNYLQKAGFRMGNRASWSKAIHAYNHSDPYVETVLTLAQWY
jgi:membrane-bound lytic murein transglycosylase B